MKVADQGARRDRHVVIPRTLIFLTRAQEQSGAQEILLIKGAPAKRLWAGKYNGLGGHVEANEDIQAAAARELAEETGLSSVPLEMRGVVHIDTGHDETGEARPGVLLFVFRGQTQGSALVSSPEGMAEWLPVAGLAALPLVDDLPTLLPRVLEPGPFFFGHYAPQSDGTLQMTFRP